MEERERPVELAEERVEQRTEERDTCQKQRLTDEGSRMSGLVREELRRQNCQKEEVS